MTIEVDYRFPGGVDPHKQARIIAVEQTVGNWDARFAHREAALRSHLAEVVLVQTETGHNLATIRFPKALPQKVCHQVHCVGL